MLKLKDSQLETIDEVAALLLTLGLWQTKCERTQRDDNLALTLNSTGKRLKNLAREIEADMKESNLVIDKLSHN